METNKCWDCDGTGEVGLSRKNGGFGLKECFDCKGTGKNPEGHFCYGCREFFHDTDSNVIVHKGCKGQKDLGICVDSKEFGKYHYSNLTNKSKDELIEMIIELSS